MSVWRSRVFQAGSKAHAKYISKQEDGGEIQGACSCRSRGGIYPIIALKGRGREVCGACFKAVLAAWTKKSALKNSSTQQNRKNVDINCVCAHA